jgi:hypothetical protein
MRSGLSIVLAAASALVAAGAALAQAVDAPHDCECRAQGALWRQGQELCIAGRLQVCGMDQNVSSWIPTGRTCPSADASPRKSRRDG